MNIKIAHSVRHLLGWIPNLLVFAALGGIGYWGYVFHWTIPDLSKPAQTTESEPPQESTSAAPDDSVNPNDTTLPEIRFTSTASVAKTGIELASAELRPMDEFVVANGSVSYDRTRLAKLSVRVPGRVFRVEKRVGEEVRKGEVLALVEASEVGVAKADFIEAMVNYKLATQTMERLDDAHSVISVRTLQEAKGRCKLAHVRRFNAMQRLANLGLPIKLEEFEELNEQEAARKLHFLGLPETLARYLDHQTCSANLIPLIAPFDAIITECNVVMGEMVSSETVQFVINDVSRMWLELDIRQEDARKLQLGQQILFSMNGTPGEIPSRLNWIGTEIDSRTRTVQARAEVVNPMLGPPNGHSVQVVQNSNSTGAPVAPVAHLVSQESITGQHLLKANAYGTARIRCRENPLAVVAPSLAVQWQWEQSQYIVFVPNPDGSSFQARRVQPGMERDGYTEILEGLAPGEQVVVGGSRMLTAELTEKLAEQQLAANSPNK